MNVRGSDELRAEAERGRILVEESREIVVVLDEEQRVIGASRRARESLQGLEEGRPLPPELVGSTAARSRSPWPTRWTGGRRRSST